VIAIASDYAAVGTQRAPVAQVVAQVVASRQSGLEWTGSKRNPQGPCHPEHSTSPMLGRSGQDRSRWDHRRKEDQIVAGEIAQIAPAPVLEAVAGWALAEVAVTAGTGVGSEVESGPAAESVEVVVAAVDLAQGMAAVVVYVEGQPVLVSAGPHRDSWAVVHMAVQNQLAAAEHRRSDQYTGVGVGLVEGIQVRERCTQGIQADHIQLDSIRNLEDQHLDGRGNLDDLDRKQLELGNLDEIVRRQLVKQS
jgi:hypothetical protein